MTEDDIERLLITIRDRQSGQNKTRDCRKTARNKGKGPNWSTTDLIDNGTTLGDESRNQEGLPDTTNHGKNHQKSFKICSATHNFNNESRDIPCSQNSTFCPTKNYITTEQIREALELDDGHDLENKGCIIAEAMKKVKTLVKLPFTCTPNQCTRFYTTKETHQAIFTIHTKNTPLFYYASISITSSTICHVSLET